MSLLWFNVAIWHLIYGLFILAAAIFVLALIPPIRGFLISSASVFTLVFAMIAAGYALFQYDTRQAEARKENTLDYISRIQSGPLSESRRWLDLFFIDNVRQESPLRQDDPDPEEVDSELERLERLAIQQHRGRDHVVSMLIFYSDVASCVNQGICDLETACDYFAREIALVDMVFNDFITEWEEVAFRDRFAGIQRFLRTCPQRRSGPPDEQRR